MNAVLGPQTDTFMLGGGLDLVSPYLTIPPGRCRAVNNFVPGLNNGYTRIAGFERFDGQPRPSQQSYFVLQLDDVSGISVTDVLEGATSGATGTVVAIDEDSLTVGLIEITGTFEMETLVSGEDVTLVLGTNAAEGGLHYDWLLAAQDEYRSAITEVPGEGKVLGVWMLGDTVYAFRSQGAEAGLFRSTASGWEQIDMPDILFFDAGTGAEIVAGDTVIGASSSASAEVLAAVTYLGAWGVDAAGYLVLGAVTGGPFTNNEALQVSAVSVALANGVNVTHVLAVTEGRYEFVTHNFYAQDDTTAIYGCDGENPAFQFDGTTFVPIFLPSLDGAPSSNAPHLISAHKGYLFLAFPNGIFQHSVLGSPLVFDGFLDAAEFGLGATITAMMSESGELLILKTPRQTFGLYGSDVDTWQLSLVSLDTGAVLFSSQRLGSILSLDDRGLAHLPRSSAYGNFEAGTVSRLVQSRLTQKRSLFLASVVVRATNQYRMFFSDGTFLVCYAREDGAFEFTEGSYQTDNNAWSVSCAANCEDADSVERVFVGGSSGMVYECEVGNSFDGDAIPAWVLLPFRHADTPRHRKRYRRAFVDLAAIRDLTLQVSATLHTGESGALFPEADSGVVFGGSGGYYDASEWGDVYYDAEEVSNVRIELTGVGTGLSLAIYNASVTEPFTLHSIRLDYDVRRLDR
jgi:hypothetical protein